MGRRSWGVHVDPVSAQVLLGGKQDVTREPRGHAARSAFGRPAVRQGTPEASRSWEAKKRTTPRASRRSPPCASPDVVSPVSPVSDVRPLGPQDRKCLSKPRALGSLLTAALRQRGRVPLSGVRFPATLSFTADAPLERSARSVPPEPPRHAQPAGTRKVAAVEPEPDRHLLSGAPQELPCPS